MILSTQNEQPEKGDTVDSNPRIKVVKLMIFPIKSCRGFEVDEWEIEERGFKYDRIWMLIDAKTNRFITGRTNPKLPTITTQIQFSQNKLLVNAPNMPTLELDLILPTEKKGEIIRGGFWSYELPVIKEPSHICEWFSKYLDQEVALVRWFEGTERMVDPTPSLKERGITECNHPSEGYFCDQFPILLANDKSMRDLNSKLTEKITIERFRPNILIDGHIEPWVEDEFKSIKISNIVIHNVKPRARCKIPTIVLEKGEYHQENEPTKTLKTFRKRETKHQWFFGLDMIHQNTGKIKLGDTVQILV